jgi:acyl carrier protein
MQAQTTVQDGIKEVYFEIFNEKLCPEDFDICLSSKGVDSLDIVDLIYNLEDKFNIKLDMNKKDSANLTLSNVADMIKERI